MDFLVIDTAGPINDLPHFLSNITLKINSGNCNEFLKNLAKKTENCPLSLLFINDIIAIDIIQQFLQVSI